MRSDDRTEIMAVFKMLDLETAEKREAYSDLNEEKQKRSTPVFFTLCENRTSETREGEYNA